MSRESLRSREAALTVPDLRLDLDATTRAPALARAEVTSWLDEHGLTSDRDDVIVVLSELVTNAVVHTTRPPTLLAVARDGHVRVEVHDEDGRGPEIAEVAGSSGGFGLRLVAKLSDRWGWSPTSTGKVVWAEFDT
jgi:anti-sigma regulatory factor (Ser/Thr protein kinase)